MTRLLTLFSGIRAKLLGLLLLSLALSFVLVAAAVSIFFTDYHSEATRVRFRDAAVRLSAAEQERLNSYWRDVRAIGTDPVVIASLNLISRYGSGAEQGAAFKSERQKLATELRRLSSLPVDTRLALLDVRGTLLSVLSIASNGAVEEAYVDSVNDEPRMRVRRFGQTEEWHDEAVPRVLLTLPLMSETASDTVWYRGQDGLFLALGIPVVKGGTETELQRVGRVVLVHEYSTEFANILARQTGFEFRIHLGQTGLPFGLDDNIDNVLDVPPLIGERRAGQTGWRETRDYFVGVRHIALNDGDYAYMLFASGKEAVRAQLLRTLGTILAAVLVAMLAALVLGQWLAKRWISNPARELVTAIDSMRTGDYRALRAFAPSQDEFGIMSRALVDMAETIGQREQENARARAELHQSEERLRQVMAVTGEGIWDWNLANDTVTHNARWCRMLGLGDDYLSHPIAQFQRMLHPDDREAVMARVTECLERQGQAYRSEHRMLREDGSVIWVVDRGDVTERDETGRPLRMVGSIVDVTLRRQAQEDLRRMNAELEDRVQARTAELTAAKEAAESATRVKSEFLANMSHEIRTPINAVLGMLYLALRGEVPEALRNYLTKAQASAHSLLGIINEILDLSKIEAGKLHLEHVDFGFDDVIERVSDVVGTQAEQKGLQFLIRYDKTIPDVLVGDPLRIGQILINLCGNSVKFTENGQVELIFRVVESNAMGLTLQVCVKDSGIGMNEEQQARLFEKFTQADQSTTRRFGGTGLGLAISKHIVEMMGGKIWLKSSKPGIGTEICFTLPLGMGLGREPSQRVQRAGVLLKGVRALVVDDNEVSLDILSEMLRNFGMEVDVYANIPAAMEAIDAAMATQPYKLVLMDWRMPGLSGAQGVQELRRNGEAAPAVVVVTAYGHADVQREAEAAGAVGFLHKPVSPSMLLNTVLVVLGVEPKVAGASPPAAMRSVALPKVLAGTRLLLVEDNEINREFARELLLSENIEVDEAVNGLEAVQKVQEREYDFVLMDVHMPVMDGMEATRQIRALARVPGGERFAHLPIVAMTALAMAQDVARGLDAGMNEHVTKPIDPERLFGTLGDLAPSRRRHGKARANGTDALPAEWLALSSLDVRGGVSRIGGKVEAYRRQLLRFRKNYAHAVGEIEQLLAEQGAAGAEAYCHALKGVCGNIGAMQLFEKITEIDDLLKREQRPSPALVEEAERLLLAVIEDIGRLMPTESPPPETA